MVPRVESGVRAVRGERVNSSSSVAGKRPSVPFCQQESGDRVLVSGHRRGGTVRRQRRRLTPCRAMHQDALGTVRDAPPRPCGPRMRCVGTAHLGMSPPPPPVVFKAMSPPPPPPRLPEEGWAMAREHRRRLAQGAGREWARQGPTRPEVSFCPNTVQRGDVCGSDADKEQQQPRSDRPPQCQRRAVRAGSAV